jgi:hypothetical protein
MHSSSLTVLSDDDMPEAGRLERHSFNFPNNVRLCSYWFETGAFSLRPPLGSLFFGVLTIRHAQEFVLLWHFPPLRTGYGPRSRPPSSPQDSVLSPPPPKGAVESESPATQHFPTSHKREGEMGPIVTPMSLALGLLLPPPSLFSLPPPRPGRAGRRQRLP